MNHQEQYEAHKKTRGQRAFKGYAIGVVSLLLYAFLKHSPEIANFLETASRSREDRAMFFEVFAVILSYVLPAIGLSAIVFTTYLLLFKKED